MKRLFLIAVVASLLLSSLFWPNKKEREKNPEDLAKEFLTLYNTRNSAAIYFFFEDAAFKPDEKGLDEVKNTLDTLIGGLGNYRGYSLITKHIVGKDMVLLSYMMKYDLMPVRFNMIYYKPNKKWLPYNFKFDTNLKEELHKSSELYLMNRTYK